MGDQRDRSRFKQKYGYVRDRLALVMRVRLGAKTRMLTAEQMERLFDETDEHNQERRQAFADYMGISLQQAIEESRSRRGFRS